MPVGYDFPLYEKGQLEVLKHENLVYSKIKIIRSKKCVFRFLQRKSEGYR